MTLIRPAIMLVFLSFTLSAFSQKDKKLADQSVTTFGIEAKVKFLASDEMKGRQTPSPEQDIAARYLATTLMGSGVKTVDGTDGYLQEVLMKSTSAPSAGSFSIGDSVYDFKQDLILISGEAGTFEGDYVYVGYGSENDFDSLDVKDKIVVARAGAPGMNDSRAAYRNGILKQKIAQDKGAIALIELFNAPQPTWKLLQYYLSSTKIALDSDEEDQSGIPRLWLEDVENKKIEVLKKYAGEVSLEIEGSETERFKVHNVVGMVEGTDPKLKEEYVIYSAHFDHVGIGTPDEKGDSIYNGTRDNAIGSMTVLEAAASIAANPLKRSALFIFFTGEEKGLLGSEWYVNHPLIPLNKMVYCFNSDNAGYNTTEILTVIGLPRTTAEPKLKEAGEAFGLKVGDDPVPEQNLYDRSDHVNFAKAGIPGLMFTLGITDFDDAIMKYYHQSADNPDSVDYGYLLKFTKAYVYACRLIGNMKETPTWIAGDKYYDAGQELYGTAQSKK